MMSEFRPFLDRVASRVHADPGTLDAVLRRAERRRALRRVAAGAVALGIAAGSLGLAYAAFRPDREARPSGAPVPGPTTTPRAIPAPVGVLLTNASRTEAAADLAAALLRSEGMARWVDVSDREATGVAEGEAASAQTTIFCHPNAEDVARSLRDRFFPGAELQGRIDPDSILVAVGDDFVRDNEALLANFLTVRRFMARRVEGSGAEVFLSDDAALEYAEGISGLDLYGYTEGGLVDVTELHPSEDESVVAMVRILGPGTVSEALTVGDHDPENGQPEVLAAERLPAGGPQGPAFEEVRAFVDAFLESRRQASGAGTYLGEDARAAYASHERGLDLLGYATGADLIGARIVTYDKLSPKRHRVTIRFEVAGPKTPIVWETLIIWWEGGDVFVVLDAERGRT
jgi:hypothetical protein